MQEGKKVQNNLFKKRTKELRHSRDSKRSKTCHLTESKNITFDNGDLNEEHFQDSLLREEDKNNTNKEEPKPLHSKFLNINEIEDFLKNKEKLFPDKIELYSIGLSRKGNDIYMVSIFNDDENCKDTKTVVMIVAGFNGCDLYSVSSALNLIEVATSNRRVDISRGYLIIPCLNPDAYASVLNQTRDNDVPLNLSHNFPIALGLNDAITVPKKQFLSAIENWKENYKFNAPESIALLRTISRYQFCMNTFIALQEEGNNVVFPTINGYNSLNDVLMTVARSAQGALCQRSMVIGPMSSIHGLVYGNVIDFLCQHHSSINFCFAINLKENKNTEITPEKIRAHCNDVFMAIKAMVLTICQIKKEQLATKCFGFKDYSKMTPKPMKIHICRLL